MLKYDIVLCCYNGAEFIIEQLQSISRQTIAPSTIYISDDASTDNTLELVKHVCTYLGLPVEISVNEKNLGYVRNFEQTLKLAKSDVVILCDQDDIWFEDKAATLLGFLSDHSNIDLVFSDAVLCDASGKIVAKSLWDSIGFSSCDYHSLKRDDIIERMLKYNIATGATFALRRNLAFKCMPFYSYYPHDAWMALYAALNNRLGFVEKKLMYYRQHDNNVFGIDKCKTKRKSKLTFDEQFYNRIRLYSELLERRDIDIAAANKVAKALNFFVIRKNIHDSDACHRICFSVLFRLMVRGEYHLFANGFRSFAKDLRALFVQSWVTK